MHKLRMARPTRFERATPAFGGQYSIQLSYGRGAVGDANRGRKDNPFFKAMIVYVMGLGRIWIAVIADQRLVFDRMRNLCAEGRSNPHSNPLLHSIQTGNTWPQPLQCSTFA